MRRRAQAPGSLTSLLDVLFILVFASLVQSSARGSEHPATSLVKVPAPAAPPPSFVALRQAAVAAATAQVTGAPLIVVHVAADGTVAELEQATGRRAIGVPLLERVVDPDVAITYLGDRAAALRVCGVVARELRTDDLAGHVVVIAPAVGLADLPVALVSGLRRDVARCQAEQHALAVIVEPSVVTP